MNALLSLVLSCALLLAASLTASHAFAHEGEPMHGEMAQMDHEDGTPLLAECCDATSGRTAPACAFDAALLNAAYGFVSPMTIIRPRPLHLPARTDAASDVPLGPPKI
jgi:hypothetical protein